MVAQFSTGILAQFSISIYTYREKGLLPFSRIRHKIFYKPEDVGKLLQSSHYPNTAAL